MSDDKKPTKPSSGGGGTSASSTTAPCPKKKKCTITSQTVATSPADRTRTKIGVGEEVKLTVSPGPAIWSKSGGGKFSPSSGSHSKVTYTAGDTAESVTITATTSDCSCTISLTVVKPSSWSMKRKSGTNLKHQNGRPECGWKGILYVHPNDVNFYNIKVREKDSKYVTTGSYRTFNNVWHGNYPPPDRVSAWISIIGHSSIDGSNWGGVDTIYSGDSGSAATGTTPPFTVGTGYFPITIQWKVGSGSAKNFPVTRQEHEIFSNGKCESRKGGNTESTMYNDPTTNY